MHASAAKVMHTNYPIRILQSRQSCEIPLILDDTYGFEGTEVQHLGTGFDDGHTAGADGFQAAILSMSAYHNKGHPDDVDGS